VLWLGPSMQADGSNEEDRSQQQKAQLLGHGGHEANVDSPC
jgi:hypothetical protein